MNSELKNVRKSINSSYQKKYMERHVTLCVTLDKAKDKDIIDWLKKQENRSVSVRNLLRVVAENAKEKSNA